MVCPQVTRVEDLEMIFKCNTDGRSSEWTFLSRRYSIKLNQCLIVCQNGTATAVYAVSWPFLYHQ